MPDEFVIELVQDIPDASFYEIESISRLNNFSIVKLDQKYAIISGDWTSLKYAAFARRISKVISKGESLETLSAPELPKGKFFVRFTDLDSCHDSGIEPKIGTFLGGKGRISFKSPDFVVRAYHLDSWFICIEVFSGSSSEFEKRRAPMRPFFSPISIDPRHARFMVNCSETRPGDLVLDPFCGTGGILLEAGILGRRLLGNDWSLQMSTGANLNLKYFGLRDYVITNEDFLKLNLIEQVDAVITDLPYGKNSRLSQKDIMDLYRSSFRKFKEVLRDNGICVVVVSSESAIKEAEPYFEILKIFPYRIHRSLTRYFAMLRRK